VFVYPCKRAMSQIILFTGIGFSLVAVWMQWNVQYRSSRLEDRYKDGRITSNNLTRALRTARLMPIAFTFLGAALLIVAATRYFG
jgi:hypothetical protein